MKNQKWTREEMDNLIFQAQFEKIAERAFAFLLAVSFILQIAIWIQGGK